MRVKDAAVICGLALFLFLAPSAALADKVDDYINSQMQRRHIPGLSLAVVRDGKIIKVKGYGLANVETPRLLLLKLCTRSPRSANSSWQPESCCSSKRAR
jgi:CubicO group peptidase (beta-lactamase class C family)